MTPVDPLRLAAHVGALLDAIGIRYVVGGSLASAVYGEPRTTLDIDLMIEADERAVRKLVKQLAAEFYVELDDALEALRHGSSFNAIHFESTMKADFFIAENRAEVLEQLERRSCRVVHGGPVFFYAPEDILVRKLTWVPIGGETQWRDAVEMLRIARVPLDETYLARAASAFDVTDLLARARRDAAG